MVSGSEGERSQQKQKPVSEVDWKQGVKRQLTLKVIFSELNLTTDLRQSGIYKYLMNVNQYPNSTWTVRENLFSNKNCTKSDLLFIHCLL